MKDVKTFVKEPGHADSYHGLTVNYIHGKTPDLVLFDANDTEVERIALSLFSTEELHELVVSRGFIKKEEL